MLKLFKLIEIATAVNLALGIIAGVFFMVARQDDVFFFPVFFAEKYIPQYSLPITYIYRSTFILVGYTMATTMYPLFYFVANGIIQAELGYSKVDDFRSTLSQNPEDYYDVEYQRVVLQNLISLTRRCSTFLLFIKFSVATIRNVIIVYTVTGCIMGTSILVYVFTLQEDNMLTYLHTSIPRLFCAVSATLMVGIFSIECGQMVEDQGDKALQVCFYSMPWYNWSEGAKQIMLINLGCLNRPVKLSFTDNISVNHNLAIQIMKVMWSIAMFILKLKSARDNNMNIKMDE